MYLYPEKFRKLNDKLKECFVTRFKPKKDLIVIKSSFIIINILKQ